MATLAAGFGAVKGGQKLLDATQNQFQAGSSEVRDPVTGQMLTDASTQTADGLAQQQAFVNALQAQGGLQNQSQVYNQLQGVVDGTGPNPAAAALAQSTGQNVANQNALMAGQRGAGQNVGLIARQAAMQGGNLQQQAAGQAATLQANQSLNALNAAGTIAGQQVGNQAAATQAYSQGAQQNQANLLNSVAQANSARAGVQANQNSINADVAKQNQAVTNQLIGSVVGGAAKAAAMAHGGEVKPASGPKSKVGQHLKGILSMPAAKMAEGGVAHNMKSGGAVPGKAQVKGDSYKNDTVPAVLSPGEVVIPKSVMESKDPAAAAAKFVAAIMARKKAKS